MINPEPYMRRTFEIEAIRITDDNYDEVALWCMAEKAVQNRPVKKGDKTEAGTYTYEEKYLKVDVLRPLNERQKMAFIGDWILKTGTSFKIYTDIAFHKNFVKKESYDDVLLPENEEGFMVLRNGQWEMMTPEELKEKFAPIVRATLEDIRHENFEEAYEKEVAASQAMLRQYESPDPPQELRVDEQLTDVPQVRLARPETSE